MSNAHTPVAPALVLRRTYAAPRQRVFAAWTKPEIAMKFLGPDDVAVTDVRMDVRTRGSYRITMLMPDGERWNVGGTYREVRPPERLVMTWRWEEDKPEDEHETLLTLEFNDLDGGAPKGLDRHHGTARSSPFFGEREK
jgi:uncharacterized protein YndB with AHSA1/START domain